MWKSTDKHPCLREVYCEIYTQENITNFKTTRSKWYKTPFQELNLKTEKKL